MSENDTVEISKAAIEESVEEAKATLHPTPSQDHPTPSQDHPTPSGGDA